MEQVAQLLTAREVAAALRVDAESVRRWAREGRIAHFRLPSGGLRFPASVLTETPEVAS